MIFNLKKLAKNILFYGSIFFIGLFFIDTILELASYPNDILIWIGMLLGFVYLARNEKDSLVQIFKEVHQSNLDEIAEQEKEEANT
jgi:hypothetical protein